MAKFMKKSKFFILESFYSRRNSPSFILSNTGNGLNNVLKGFSSFSNNYVFENDYRTLHSISKRCTENLPYSFKLSFLNRDSVLNSTSKKFSIISHAPNEWDGGKSMADEMIRYSLSSKGHGLEESILTMKHGLSFLLREGESASDSAGRVLLHLASLHVDMGNFSESFEALQQAIMLKGVSHEIEVAAHEARIGLLLRCQQDDAALEDANEFLGFITDLEQKRNEKMKQKEKGKETESDNETIQTMDDLEEDDNLLSLRLRSYSSLAYVYHFKGKSEESEKWFVEASSLQDKISDTNMNGIASTVLSDAHHMHALGKLSCVQSLYEECLSLARSAESLPPHLVVADVAMKPQEVVIGALCGLGQLAIHRGDLEEAEKQLLSALNESEKMSGEKHVRNGCILSLVAHLYYCKGKKNAGEYLVSEGLYRKALDLLKVGGSSTSEGNGNGKDFGMHDMIALTQARYATLLRRNSNREHEAVMHDESSFHLWKSIWPIQVALANGFPKMEKEEENNDSKSLIEEINENYGQCTVVDVRIGRILI